MSLQRHQPEEEEEEEERSSFSLDGCSIERSSQLSHIYLDCSFVIKDTRERSRPGCAGTSARTWPLKPTPTVPTGSLGVAEMGQRVLCYRPNRIN